MADARPLNLFEIERASLEAALRERGHEPFRARQIFAWLYKKGATGPDAMTDLPLALRAMLAREFTLTTPSVERRETSTSMRGLKA